MAPRAQKLERPSRQKCCPLLPLETVKDWLRLVGNTLRRTTLGMLYVSS